MPCHCCMKQDTVEFHAERLYTSAHDTFAQLNKVEVESQLVCFFIDGMSHDYLQMKIIRENPKTFHAVIHSALAEQNL